MYCCSGACTTHVCKIASATCCGATCPCRGEPYISPALVSTIQGQSQGANKHHSPLGLTPNSKTKSQLTVPCNSTSHQLYDNCYSCVHSMGTAWSYRKGTQNITAEVQAKHSVVQQPCMIPILLNQLVSMLQLCSIQPHILTGIIPNKWCKILDLIISLPMSFYALNFVLIFTINLNRRYIGMQPVTLPVTKQRDMKHILHATQGPMTR